MHHLSNLSVVPLLCVRPVLSLCGKGLWKHVHVRFDLYSEEAQTTPVDAECLQALGGDPCLPVISLLSRCWRPLKHPL